VCTDFRSCSYSDACEDCNVETSQRFALDNSPRNWISAKTVVRGALPDGNRTSSYSAADGSFVRITYRARRRRTDRLLIALPDADGSPPFGPQE